MPPVVVVVVVVVVVIYECLSIGFVRIYFDVVHDNVPGGAIMENSTSRVEFVVVRRIEFVDAPPRRRRYDARIIPTSRMGRMPDEYGRGRWR